MSTEGRRQFFLDHRFEADGGIGFVHPSYASRAQPDSTEKRLEQSGEATPYAKIHLGRDARVS
jgi:hypothetical protein